MKTNPNADPKIYCGMERLTIDLSQKINGYSEGEVVYHFSRKGMPKEKFYLIRGETAERTRPTDSLKSTGTEMQLPKTFTKKMGEYGKKWGKTVHDDLDYYPSIKEVINGLNIFWN